MSAEPFVNWPRVVGWSATVLCATVSARSAAAFARHAPRIFTVLALFALNWALFIPYYSECQPSELLNGFSGFLLVYIGILLRREKRITSSSTQQEPPEISTTDALAMWLFLGLIAPSAISLPFPPGVAPNKLVKFFDFSVTAPVLATLMTVVGYFTVASAIRVYSTSKKGWIVLVCVITAYASTEVAFAYWQVIDALGGHKPSCLSSDLSSDFFWIPAGGGTMSPPFLYAFSALKILFTALFIWLVLRERMSDEDRELSFIQKPLRWLGVI